MCPKLIQVRMHLTLATAVNNAMVIDNVLASYFTSNMNDSVAADDYIYILDIHRRHRINIYDEKNSND